MQKFIILLPILAALLVPVSRMAAAPGDLDGGFGSGGMVTTLIGSDSKHYDVTVQNDGKIVAVGIGNIGSYYDMAVVRYHSDGSLDLSFNSTGHVTTDFGGDIDAATCVAMQADNKILVAGYTTPNGSYDFALARYLTNGSLDPAFGTNGKVITDFNGQVDIAYDLCVQADGKIVVAGYAATSDGSHLQFAVARYQTDGTLDPTFNGTGKVTTSMSSSGYATAVSIQSDGKIVVAGTANDGINDDFAVVRYQTTGAVDTTFNGTGMIITDLFPMDNFVSCLDVQADDKIVLGGYSYLPGLKTVFALARLESNGAVDTTFGTGGAVTTAVGNVNDYLESISIQANGKIVGAGYSANSNGDFDTALVRYQENGSLDSSFHADGIVTADTAGNNDELYATALQSDGKIVVAGASLISGVYNMTVRRYLGDPVSSGPLPQKVVFCYDEPCPFNIVPDSFIIEVACGLGWGSCNGSDHSVKWDAANPMPAANVLSALRQPYLDAVKKAFQDNGVITGMSFSIGAPEPDAINVYFGDPIPTYPGLAGIAQTGVGRPDRFNYIRRGDVYIRYAAGDDADRVKTIVHEIGHCLGMVHIDPRHLPTPPAISGPVQSNGLAWNQCVMDYGAPTTSPPLNTPISFFGDPAWCANPGASSATRFDFDSRTGGDRFATSNEKFYLQQWVEKKIPDIGLTAGDYEKFDFTLPDYNACNARFSMATSQTLHNVTITQESFTGESIIVGEYASLTPAQWSALQLDLPSQGKITMVGSTSPSLSEADVIMVAAPTGQPMDFAIPLSGTVPLEMLQLTGTSTFTTIGVGEVQRTVVATTTAAGAVTSGWATLNGEVILSGSTGTAWFEYGTTDAYGRKTYDSSIPSGTGSTSVSFNIGGLLKGTTYHYRLMVTNADGIVYGQDQTFTTPAVTSPPAWHSAQLTSMPNAADGSRTGAAHPTASLYYYKGTDSNVWASYWNGTQWAQAQLSSDANVDDWLSYGTSYGLLAYKGKDNKLWVAYWTGSAWAVAPLGSNPNVAGDVVMDDAWNLIYYRGTDSRVWVAYWSGTQWTQASLGGAVPVVGNLAVDGSHHIVYFQGGSSGNEMWCYYWSGAAWLQAQLSTASNVGGSVAADTGGGLAYYRSSADNSAWCVYWNGSAWAYGQLDAAAAMGTSTSIAPLARNTALYLNNNGQCAAEYWGGSSWGSTVLGDGGWGLTGGLSVQRSTNLVFTRRNDGHVVIFYYQ
jgi:uncharacterized delta-60 repeat protein